MERRRAKKGEYIINLNTGEVKKAVFVLESGEAAINEFFPVCSDSTELVPIHWAQEDYLVIPYADLSMLR
ncbi:MAG: hypothetical protein U9Q88_00345 [Bacillota bacterium]|nr:hypothetical protein [Bacillota bacterium]